MNYISHLFDSSCLTSEDNFQMSSASVDGSPVFIIPMWWSWFRGHTYITAYVVMNEFPIFFFSSDKAFHFVVYLNDELMKQAMCQSYLWVITGVLLQKVHILKFFFAGEILKLLLCWILIFLKWEKSLKIYCGNRICNQMF